MSGMGIYVAIGGFTLFFLLVLGVVGLLVWFKSKKQEPAQILAEPLRMESPQPRNKVREAFDAIDDATKDFIAVDFCKTVGRQRSDEYVDSITKAFQKRSSRRSPKPQSQSPVQ